MKRVFRTHCVTFSNGLKGSTCLYWTDCSFAEKREIVPSRDELFDVWFQNASCLILTWKRHSYWQDHCFFCQRFALAKCFDLSRRSEMCLLTSFLYKHCFSSFLLLLLLFLTKLAIMICLMPMRCLSFGGVYNSCMWTFISEWPARYHVFCFTRLWF